MVALVAAAYRGIVIAVDVSYALAGKPWGDELSVPLAFILTGVPILMASCVVFLSPTTRFLSVAARGSLLYGAIGLAVVPLIPFIQSPGSLMWIGSALVWPFLVFATLGCPLPLLPCPGY